MRILFDRVGRAHDVAPLTVADDATADEIAEAVHRYVRPYLLSRDVNVYVDLEQGRGGIFCGFRDGGTFTVDTPDHVPTR